MIRMRALPEPDRSAMRVVIYQRMLMWVVKLAFKKIGYAKRSGLTLLDLISEGSIGLDRAIDKFDPDIGNTLSTLRDVVGSK